MDEPKPKSAREELTSEAVGKAASYARFLPGWAVKEFADALMDLVAVAYENGRTDEREGSK